jgi:hypothetical protein
MKKLFILFSFLTVFTVISVSAGNMPVPTSAFFLKSVKNEILQKSQLPIIKTVGSCTSTTTCGNGTTASATAATCAESGAAIVAWLRGGGCRQT